MKIPVDDIPQSPKEIKFSESVEELNEAYSKASARDFRFPPFLDVDLVYYRSGRQLFFHGSLRGVIEGCCSRCLKDYTFSLQNDFAFVLSPAPAESDRKVEELSREDLGLSYYSTDEINLTPLIREQAMLALPTRPLCEENCRGFCGGCGVDLNHEACVCSAAEGDPRMAIFRTLKVGR
ncbi:MAG TPA: DUF177 domain-containing protein [Methylomirabilota bacterium]|nr:DUF177 domain-containing protein [Methylomirabilota bacterium]